MITLSRFSKYLAAIVLLIVAPDCLGQLTVLEPNGGEVCAIGGTMTIRWLGGSPMSNVTILLSRDGGSTWPTTVVDSTANDGRHIWTVTGPPSTQCRIGIGTSLTNYDMSDADFTILEVGEPTVVTLSAEQDNCGFVTLRGRLDDDGGESCRVVFGYSPDLTGPWIIIGHETEWQEGITTGQTFTATVPLVPGGHVEYVARAQNSLGTSHGGVVAFDAPGTGILVPDLNNMKKSEVQAALQEAGLILGTVSGDPSGRVTSQSPGAGKEVCEGSAVAVTMGGGEVEVPDLTGLSQSEAEQVLSDMELRLGTIWYGQSDLQPGLVFSQDPEAGSIIGKEGEVDIVISNSSQPECSTIPLLIDGDFEASFSSADLRVNSQGQDWYESRQDEPTLVTLNATNVGGNATKKVKLSPSTVGNAYLTQEFSTPQTQMFMAQWDIYVDSILDRPDSIYDRAAWVFIGDDTGTTPDRTGPNAEDSERFAYLGFYKSGGGTSGTMDLVARESSTTTTTFRTLVTGLSLKRWYTITVYCDLAQDTYEVCVDGKCQGTVKARTPKSSVTHISFAEWSQGEGAATFYVDNVEANACLVPSCGSFLVDSDFEASFSSADLRVNSQVQDWYESRQDEPTLVTLDATNVGGNATKKVKLSPSTLGSAYLTQEFSTPQTQVFMAQWDIYVDSILDRPDSIYDRAAWVFIGDDTGTTSDRTGPNAEDSERFAYLGFYKSGGGTSGTMDLVARERSETATTFITVATGLSLKQWYTITVFCDLTQDNYDVFIDGQFQMNVKARTPKSSVTHISFAEWSQSEGAATFYVDNVIAECVEE